MIFVFDLDDTLCETDDYSEKYILNFFQEHKLPYKLISKNARFAEKKFDWDMETALSWYKEFGDEMYTKIPLKKGALEFIEALNKAGHKIVICTARATDWHTDPEGMTKKWLENFNVYYYKLYTGVMDKEKVCELENADVFIDDDIKITARVAEYFNSLGKKDGSYLMTTAYNKNLETASGVTRVSNFEELGKLLNLK